MLLLLRTSISRSIGLCLALLLAPHAWAATPLLKAPVASASAPAKPGAIAVAPLPVVVGKVAPTPAPAPTAVTAPPAPPGPNKVGPVYFKQAKVKVYTGSDNKEAPSAVWATLYINGGATDDNGGLNPDRLVQLTTVQLGRGVELPPNTVTETVIEPSPGAAARSFESAQVNSWHEADRRSLALCQQYGLRLEIKYDPNFVLDAWEIKRVDLEVDFGSWEGWVMGQSWRFLARVAPGYPRTITFNRTARLSDGNRKLVLVTDGFFFPK